MKINPIGVQSYRQTVQREQKPPVKTEKDAQGVQDSVLDIRPQSVADKSSLAVKAPEGNYTDFLTMEERSALELLFSRFNDTGRFGSDLSGTTAGESGHQPVGRLIDLKV